jgi:hypothetical protein
MSGKTLIILAVAAIVVLYFYSQSSSASASQVRASGPGLSHPITSQRAASGSQLLQNSLGNLGGGNSANLPANGSQVETSPNGSPGAGYSPSGGTNNYASSPSSS